MYLPDRPQDYLFSTTDLTRSLDATMTEVGTTIDRIPAEQFLNTAPADLVSHLVEKHGVEPVKLLRE